MKNRILILLSLLVLLLASCIDSLNEMFSGSPEVEVSIDEVKAAFERDATALEVRPFTTSKTTKNGGKSPVITPLWAKGYAYMDKEGTFVSVPLNLPLVKTFAVKREKSPIPDNEKYNNTDIRLLVQKSQENEYFYQIVHITGDFSYVIDKKRDVKQLKLDDLKSFSGDIRYFSLQGELMFGYIYKNGEKVGTISPSDKSGTASRDKPQTRGGYYEEICEDHLIEYETCYHWGYDDGEGFVETGYECYYDYVTETYCYPSWVEEEDPGCPSCGSAGCDGSCSNTGDNDDGDKKQTPCDKANSLNEANNTLHDKVKSFFNSVLSAKAGDHESGWIKTADGKYISPISSTSTSLTYSASAMSGNKATESYHTHPAGSCIPSWGDLKRLAQMYKDGQIDVDDFSYGVITSMGCTSMVISNESEFSALADRVLNDNGPFEDKFRDMTLLGGGVEQTIANFLGTLGVSGLNIILNQTEYGSDDSSSLGGWTAKEPDNSGGLTNSICK